MPTLASLIVAAMAVAMAEELPENVQAFMVGASYGTVSAGIAHAGEWYVLLKKQELSKEGATLAWSYIDTSLMAYSDWKSPKKRGCRRPVIGRL